ncbi:hypothetical protein CRUP_013744 [Coryphaenoides rupestris]|nr:hypothetical protein CRUP_013744 [Coryphaenoides rupestris]
MASDRSTGLDFPQNEYLETVYLGQPAGSPVLQVHAVPDTSTERAHFYLCYPTALRAPAYTHWFHMDVNTGVLYLNKTLEESDFAPLRELPKTLSRLVVW